MTRGDESRLGDRIGRRAAMLYGEARAASIRTRIETLAGTYRRIVPPLAAGWSERDALLIAYGDTLIGAGSPLSTLDDFASREAAGIFTFLHLLPFYPYTSDDGFAVKDFRAVRPDLGTWTDIARLARGRRLVFDGVINHVSASSAYVTGYCAGDPRYADFCLALDPAADTSSVLRTRNLPLLHAFQTAAGPKWLWTTFSRDQVDLNFANPEVLLDILDVLLGYAARGAAMIRLDAVPYLWKQPGTSCAHLPGTHEIIKLIRDVFDLAAPHVLLLTETNCPHEENTSYFGDRGDEAQIVYNFTLAPLILWSLHKGDASVLTEWAGSIAFAGERATYLNITATHDGIGMRPTEGILPEAARAELVRLARDHGGDVTGKRNADGSITPYELNLNYFDAVNDPRREESLEWRVRRFLVSQAIPMSLMGIPGVYIHSLLGSRNDHAAVEATGRARSINRARLPLDEVRRELATPASRRAHVFGGIQRLLTVRSRQSAFHPDAGQHVLHLSPGVFAVARHDPSTGQRITALHNVTGQPLSLTLSSGGVDLLTGEPTAQSVRLDGYQVRWIETPR